MGTPVEQVTGAAPSSAESKVGVVAALLSVAILTSIQVILDIGIFAIHTPRLLEPLAWAALALPVASLVTIVCAVRRRSRSLLWAGLVAAALAPGLLADSVGTRWWATAGHIAIDLMAVGTFAVATALRPHFGSAMTVDRWTATVIQILATVVAILQIAQLDAPNSFVRTEWSAEFLGALVITALVNSRTQLPYFWELCAGFFLATVFWVLIT